MRNYGRQLQRWDRVRRTCAGDGKEHKMGSTSIVLLVEDDRSVADFVESVLTEAGLAVSKASTVEDAAKLLEQETFALAILDIYLPDGSGLELARKIRSQDSKLPVIIITGVPGGDNVSESLDVGVDAYLIKPVDVGNLLNLVDKLIERRPGEKGTKSVNLSE